MNDRYSSYADLAANETEGVRYRVDLRYAARAKFFIVAPHGGDIEPATSDIARYLAGTNHSFYAFEGISPENFHHLHITSTKFDEPRCLGMVRDHDKVVAIHGCAGAHKAVYVGGLDNVLGKKLVHIFGMAGIHATDQHHPYPGIQPDNICNRGRSGSGIQLEITRGLRDSMSPGHLAQIIRVALG